MHYNFWKKKYDEILILVQDGFYIKFNNSIIIDASASLTERLIKIPSYFQK